MGHPCIANQNHPVPCGFAVSISGIALDETAPKFQQEIGDIEAAEMHDVTGEEAWNGKHELRVKSQENARFGDARLEATKFVVCV